MYRNNRKTVQKNKSESPGKIAAYIANYSQFALLLLAIFGYFYTVQPVYQNQKLNEENAQLQQENNRLKLSSDGIRLKYESDYQKYKSEIEKLNTQLRVKEGEYKNTIEKYDSTKNELESMQKMQQESYDRTIANSKEFLKKILLSDLRREILAASESRQKTLYKGQEERKDFFEIVATKKNSDIDKYIDDTFKNPVEYLYPTIIFLLDKYRLLSDDDSIYKTKSLILLESEARKNKESYQLQADKVANVKIRSRTYVKDINEIRKSVSLFRDYEKEYDIQRAYLNDISDLSKALPDSENILKEMYKKALNYDERF